VVDVRKDIQKLKVPNWKTLAQDRRRWKELVEKAKTLHKEKHLVGFSLHIIDDARSLIKSIECINVTANGVCRRTSSSGRRVLMCAVNFKKSKISKIWKGTK
jgi:hypothetical protein